MADAGVCAKTVKDTGEIRWGYQWMGGYGYSYDNDDDDDDENCPPLCPWGYGYHEEGGNCMLNRDACGNFCSDDVSGVASLYAHIPYNEALHCPPADSLMADYAAKGWNFELEFVSAPTGSQNYHCAASVKNPGGLDFLVPLRGDWMYSEIGEDGSPLASYDADAVLLSDFGGLSFYTLRHNPRLKSEYVVMINDDSLDLLEGGDEFTRGAWGEIDGGARYVSLLWSNEYWPRLIYRWASNIGEANPGRCLLGGDIRETGYQVYSSFGGVANVDTSIADNPLPAIPEGATLPYHIDLKWGVKDGLYCVPDPNG